VQREGNFVWGASKFGLMEGCSPPPPPIMETPEE